MNNENSSSPSANTDIQTFLGRHIYVNNNQFFVESILGQGGFAYVFLVRSTYYHQQRYALKRMYVNNQRDLSVCVREIDLLKEFSSHKNIVKYVDSSIRCLRPRTFTNRQYQAAQRTKDYDDEDDSIYEILLLTEFCTQGSLVARLTEQHRIGNTMTQIQILKIFADLCRAVSVCHFRRPNPILHRDIKLENVIMHTDNSFVLCDFGSALVLSRSKKTGLYEQCPDEEITTSVIQRLEENIQRYTTLSYRAPEMIDLYARIPITLKADIWAMGCVLYKLMFNELPFGESVLAIQNGHFVIPDHLSNLYSRELKLFVKYMLEIDIHKRPDIWQVSAITFKLLGQGCPISNHCQSKDPDLESVSLPLTSSAYDEQRRLAAAKVKPTSTQIVNETPSVGTTIKPRERPRGIAPASISLMNLKLANNEQGTTPTLPVSKTSSSQNQLLFDDNFGQQIPDTSTSLVHQSSAPVVPPRIPKTKSVAAGQSHQTHRRSISQTITATTDSTTSASNASAVISSQTLSKDEENWWINTPDSQVPLQQHRLRTNSHHRSRSDAEQKSTTENLFYEFDPYQNKKVEQSTNSSTQNQSVIPTNIIVQNETPRTFTNLNVNNTTSYSTTNVQFYPYKHYQQPPLDRTQIMRTSQQSSKTLAPNGNLDEFF